jgi:GntR family transcriptional regulator
MTWQTSQQVQSFAWQTCRQVACSLSSVSERDWRPRYLQVAEQLRARIERGELKPGDPLPSETELAATSDLSRTSVRNAIRQLREWGLVRAEQGRGTFVRPLRHRLRRDNASRYQWEKDRVRLAEDERRKTGGTEQDTGLTVDDLEFHAEYRVIEAPVELAEEFGIEPGSPLLERDYWTSARTESAALSMSRSWLRHDLIAGNPALLDPANEPWPGGTQHQLFTVDIELDQITDRIIARPPLPHEAELLDIEPGVAVLVMHKTSVDMEGRVVEIAEAVFAGDRTELTYTTKLKRWKR